VKQIIAVCEAVFFEAQLDHDAAVQAYEITLQDADLEWITETGICQADYDTGAAPCNDMVQGAEVFAAAMFIFELIVYCGYLIEPDLVASCIVTTFAIHFAAQAAILAAYTYCIWPVWSAYDECMRIANDRKADIVADAQALKDAADEVWLAAQATHSTGLAQAQAAYDAALAACAAQAGGGGDPGEGGEGGEEGGGNGGGEGEGGTGG
jgi:hypothetical protein